MLIYYLILFVIILPSILSQLEKDKRYFLFAILILGAFLCTSYMPGSDWIGYEEAYRTYQSKGIVDDDHTELGFKLLFTSFATLGIDFWWFFISGKIFCFVVFIKRLLRYTKGKYAWGLVFLYGYAFLYAFIDCPFRNLLAATFMLLAMDNIISGNKFRIFLFTLISVSIHISALIVLPIYYFVYKRKRLFNKTILIVILFVEFTSFTILWSSGLADQIQVAASFIFGDFKNVNYVIQKGSGFSFGLIAIILIYIWVLIGIKEDKLTDIQKFICNLSPFYMFFYISFYFIPMTNRFTLFFLIPFSCVLSIGIYHAKKSIIKTGILCLFVMFLSIAMKNTITLDHRYVPYTSYLQYIFREKPRYNYRINYNYNHSPYKNNQQTIEYITD